MHILYESGKNPDFYRQMIMTEINFLILLLPRNMHDPGTSLRRARGQVRDGKTEQLLIQERFLSLIWEYSLGDAS